MTLRKAINTLPFRIGLFYVGALMVIMSVASGGLLTPGNSPFVEVFELDRHPGRGGHHQLRPADRRPVLVQLRHLLHRPHAPQPVADAVSAGRSSATLSVRRVPFAGIVLSAA